MREKPIPEIFSLTGTGVLVLKIDGREYHSAMGNTRGELLALYSTQTGEILHANGPFCECFDLTEGEVLHSPVSQVIPEGLHKKLCRVTADITRQKPVNRTVHRFSATGGTVRWQEWTCRGFFDRDETPDILLASGRDITGYGEALEGVSEFDAFYQHFIENLTDVVFFTDRNGIIRYISRVVEELTQWKVDEVTGLHYMTFIHPDDMMTHIEYMKAVLNGNNDQPFVTRIQDSDGAYHYAKMVSRRVVKDGEVEGVVGIISHAADEISNEYQILKMLLYLLSGNERTVLMLLAGNETRRDIARIMDTVPEAVDTYIRRIKKKLNTDDIDPILEMIRMFPRDYFLRA